MFIKTNFDHGPLVDAVSRRCSEEHKAARAEGRFLAMADAVATEFRFLADEFTDEQYWFYAGLFYPIIKDPFLSTSYWETVRNRVMFVHNRRCRCGRVAREVHHQHYGICGEEHLHTEDGGLVPLCSECHSAVHDSYESPGRLENPIFAHPEFRTISPCSPLCFVCMKYHPLQPRRAEWIYAEPNGQPEVDVSQTANFLFCDRCREEWIRDQKFAGERFLALKGFELWVWVGILEAFVAGGNSGCFYGIGKPRLDLGAC